MCARPSSWTPRDHLGRSLRLMGSLHRHRPHLTLGRDARLIRARLRYSHQRRRSISMVHKNAKDLPRPRATERCDRSLRDRNPPGVCETSKRSQRSRHPSDFSVQTIHRDARKRSERRLPRVVIERRTRHSERPHRAAQILGQPSVVNLTQSAILELWSLRLPGRRGSRRLNAQH